MPKITQAAIFLIATIIVPHVSNAQCANALAVPPLVGKPAVEAYVELQELGLNFQVTAIEDSICASQNDTKYIQATIPEAGSCLDPDAPPLVIVNIQRGKASLETPRIVGLTQEQAAPIVESKNLRLQYSKEEAVLNLGLRCTVALSDGFGTTITTQYPREGQAICPEATITGINRERTRYVNISDCIEP